MLQLAFYMNHSILRSAPILIILAGATLILSFTAGHFYNETLKYKEQNRALIIQNDSILSVNIELKNAIRFISTAKKTTPVSFKIPNTK